METLTLNHQNIRTQHICCAFSDKKCKQGYQKKKSWLRNEFQNGYKFKKVDARGKVFIEYVPIEHSWLPLEGSNFMVINCFWVSGQFKGLGHGKALLHECMQDSGSLDGIVAITGDKKRPFMSDPKFFKYHGFEIIDEAPPFFRLWGLKSNPAAKFPQFKDTARLGQCANKRGITAYYSNTCPYTDYYTGTRLRQYAQEKQVPLTIHRIKSQEEGQNMPIPWVINSVFYKGELVTLEMKAERHLEKVINATRPSLIRERA